MAFDAQLIEFNRYPKRAKNLFRLLSEYTGIPITREYTGNTQFILLWGYGGAAQQKAIRAHRAKGGTVIAFDVGYFKRQAAFKYAGVRVTINDPHPNKYIDMAGGGEKWNKLGIKLQHKQNPKGGILLCGMGEKSRAFYGLNGAAWEKAEAKKIKAAFPNTRYLYRPKPKHKERLEGFKEASAGDIGPWLGQSKLTVCYHSNVSIDCAVYGTACSAVDGIGATLYSRSYDIEVPTEAERLALLHKAAWFNWQPGEVPQMIEWLKGNLV